MVCPRKRAKPGGERLICMGELRIQRFKINSDLGITSDALQYTVQLQF